MVSIVEPMTRHDQAEAYANEKVRDFKRRGLLPGGAMLEIAGADKVFEPKWNDVHFAAAIFWLHRENNK